MHFIQQWFKLSDLSVEDVFFETPLYREFAQLPLQRGLLIKGDTAVDATLTAAQISTKNKTKTQDPLTHSCQKVQTYPHWRGCRTGLGPHRTRLLGQENSRHRAH